MSPTHKRPGAGRRGVVADGPSSSQHIEVVMSELQTSPSGPTGLRNRIRYRFDNLLARGTWAVLLWLGLVTFAAVLVSSGILTVFGVDFASGENTWWLEDFWQSLLRVLDPGTMAGDVGWGRRALALLITLFGILVAGTLIGLIASGVEQRVEEMRRGRSYVVESDHVAILGASSRLPVVVEQLAIANRSRRSNVIVVLADREPVELSDDVRAAVDDLHGSRVVFRSGDPARVADLRMVALRDARAVIVLAEDEAAGDGAVVKAVLAARAELGAFDRIPIVAELHHADAAEGLLRASDGAVHVVVGARSVGRITAFALREPGLNRVVEELLDFRGSEVYVHPVDGLAGESFGACVFRFPTARPIGRIRADGAVDLNPDPQTRLDVADRLIVIADDRTAAPAARGFGEVPPVTRRDDEPAVRQADRVLIVGWNVLGAQLVASLDEIATPGSSVEIVYDPTAIDPDDVQVPDVGTLAVTRRARTRPIWELAQDERIAQVTAIVLLARRSGIAADEADSRTLLDHMLLRRELDARGGDAPRVVVELRDVQNVDLAQVAGVDDYVVSDAITSRLMGQLAEQPQRRPILLSLYAADGPSVRLVPAGDLGLRGAVGFDHVISAAYGVGLLALGWRRGADVVLNPAASERVVLHDDDQIVAIG